MKDYVSKVFMFTAVISLPICSIAEQISNSSERDPLLCRSARTSFECLISSEEIDKKLQEIAQVIDQNFEGEEVTIVMILKGGVFLAVDLMRKLKTPCILEHIQASSYGAHGKERGELTITGLERLDISGKNVLIVEDIFDSGFTLSGVVKKLSALEPKTLRTVVLLLKKGCQKTEYRPDYVLFEIENRFVVGYGLDYKERWRELPEIVAVE